MPFGVRSIFAKPGSLVALLVTLVPTRNSARPAFASFEFRPVVVLHVDCRRNGIA
jgi:hypothetical protein